MLVHPIPNLVLLSKLVQHAVKVRDSDSNMLGIILTHKSSQNGIATYCQHYQAFTTDLM